ncbi:Hypothetical protein KNT65_gp152 [Escherichia phage EcS1]|uniref:DUF7418 domain-containing protein n=1 Tax=Escherichia phage EcS1 TaxID=2083276 RepID=A0A2Z5ZD69_9CAUD|nr:Hypothetical protein KNT65_gp152 [Escherichia phage EcS1]BBC78341.1 Hypothetical protein [Escherichia phage EcS1]
MNEGDKKINKIFLHGNHKADIVYCKDVIFDEKYDGILVVKDLFVGLTDEEIDALDRNKLNHDDRIYYGVIYVKCVKLDTGEVTYGTDESGLGPIERIEDTDFHGQGFES